MRTAVLGCGSVGRRHARNARGLGVRDLVVYDIDAARATALAAELGAEAAPTLEAVWASRPSVALIATPSFQHLPQALAALQHGCDLFVEKPLGHVTDGIGTLVADARARQRVTLVGCNMRFHPGPAAVKRLIDAGAVGRVLSARIQTGSYLPSWRPGDDYHASYSASRQQGGGAALDCIHEIDLALWYFGPATLCGAAALPATAIGLDVEGVVELLLAHTAGMLSSVHLNFVQRDYRRICQVIGETGTIYWDFASPEVVVRRERDVETYRLPADWTVNEMYVDELRHFFDCVATRRPSIAPLEHGLAALDLALAARTCLQPGSA